MAQLVAHHTGSVGVRGSSPLSSTYSRRSDGFGSKIPLCASEKTSGSSRWASIRIRQRADGSMSYTVLYWQDGKQSPLTFRDEPSAEAFKLATKAHGVRRALEMHGYEIRAAESETPGLTVAEWIRHHIDHLTGIEQYTLDVYERYLKNDIAPTLGAIPLAQLSEEDIALWIKGHGSGDRSPPSTNVSKRSPSPHEPRGHHATKRLSERERL